MGTFCKREKSEENSHVNFSHVKLLLVLFLFFAFTPVIVFSHGIFYADPGLGGDGNWYPSDDPDCWNSPSWYYYPNSCNPGYCNVRDGCDLCQSNPDFCGTNFDSNGANCNAASAYGSNYHSICSGRFQDSGTTASCCMTNGVHGEYYTGPCSASGNVAWGSGYYCLNQGACCNSPGKCVYGSCGYAACYGPSGGGDTVEYVGNGETNDVYANCYMGTWYDIDDYGYECSSFGGSWEPAGDYGVGEYPSWDFTTSKCCGDDAGENARYCDAYGNVAWWGSCSGGYQHCCLDYYSCVSMYDYGGTGPSCVSNGYSSWGGAYGADQNVYCNQGAWIDEDSSHIYCEAAGYSWGVGYGNANGEQSTSACCGDDAGENNEYRIEETGFYFLGTGSRVDTGSDNSCCADNYPCVYNHVCYAYSDTHGGDTFCGFMHNFGQGWFDYDENGDGMAFMIDQNNNGEACTARGWGWNVGGSGNAAGEYSFTKCCGDDSSEYKSFRNSWTQSDCNTYDSGCTGGLNIYITDWSDSTSDQTCCNVNSDCVMNGVCYPSSGAGRYASVGGSGDDTQRSFCNNYIGQNWWLDCDSDSGACTSICGLTWIASGDGNIGEYNQAPHGNPSCCGDDTGEILKSRVCNSGCSSNGGDQACCGGSLASGTCVYNGNCYGDWAYSTCTKNQGGSCVDTDGNGVGDITCTQTQGWKDADVDSNGCAEVGGYWNIGGEVSGSDCCTDDSGEYRKTRSCAGGSGCSSDGTDDACCDSNTDCVYGSTCYSSGSNYCAPYNSNLRVTCNSGTWNLVEDCTATATWDSDGRYAYQTQGYIYDYDTCASGASCHYNQYNDYCVGTSVVDYYSPGSGTAGDTYDCQNYEGTLYCSGGRYRYRQEWSCSGNPGYCNDAAAADTLQEDCQSTASTDTDGGNAPGTAGTVTDYTGCTVGTSCTTATYSDTCVSGTQLTEYYPNGASYSSQTYTCANFEVGATDTYGNDPTHTEACTAGTAAGCSSNTFTGSAGSGSGTDYCSGTCGTGANSCVFVEYYPVDSGDSCPGTDSCTTQNYDADTNSNTCNQCRGAGYWAIGGEVAPAACCGDDNAEYKLTRSCAGGSGCTTDGSDDACCNANNKCVYSSTCYSTGNQCAPYDSNLRVSCGSPQWSLVEDCSAKASTDTDGGNSPGTAGTVTDYTNCASGAACNSNTYSDTCVSGTQLTEYYPNGASYSSQTYTCANFEVGATDTYGNDPTHTEACTAGTAAGCSSGAFTTSAGTGGGTDYCSGTCGTGTNSCVFVEYYPVDSADSCGGTDSCTTQNYDADTNSNTCSQCRGAGYWAIGGEVAPAACCGDDNAEYRISETGTTDIPAGYNDGVNTCCDTNTDCNYNGGCTATTGVSAPAIPNKAYCNAGTWNGADASNAACTAIVGAGYWAIGGEVSAADCCADDNGEYRITETGTTDIPVGYNDGVNACCDTNTDCNYNGACTATTGVSAPAIPNKAYCNAGTWNGADASNAACTAIVGAGYWAIGGEVSAADCCADDNGEYRITETGTTDIPVGYNDGVNACCDTNTDCNYNGACTATTGVSAPAIPNKSYCNGGTWNGGDASNAACTAIVAAGRWALGGEVAAANCCGDDNGEYYTPTGIGPDRCCDAATDCVDGGGTCRSGTESPGTATCNDGIDNDCDGKVDWNDSDCCPTLSGAQFKVMNITGSNCLIVDASGNVALKGDITTGAIGNIPQSAYLINVSNSVVGYVAKNCSMRITGTINVLQGSISGAGTAQFVYSNTGSRLVFKLDSSGNMYATGTFGTGCTI